MKLAKELKLSGSLSLDLLVRAPGFADQRGDGRRGGFLARR